MLAVAFIDTPQKKSNNEHKKSIDLSHLVKQMQGKKAVILELIDLIIQQLNEDVPKIDNAITKKDYKTIKQLSHKMKSTVFAVGISELGTILEEMESCALSNKGIKKIVLLNSRLNILTKQVIEELNSERVKYK